MFKHAFEKIAVIGPLIDALDLGFPSTAGYLIGRNEALKEGPEELDPPSTAGKILKGALIPGYIGYRYGKADG